MPIKFIEDLLLTARDAALDAAGVPLPEKTFAQAMTGGARGGKMTSLPDNVRRDIRKAYDRQFKSAEHYEKELAALDRDIASGEINTQQFESMGMTPQDYRAGVQAKLDQVKSGIDAGNTDMYGASRDAHLTLGNVGVYQAKDGSVLIKDKWKVDNPDDRIDTDIAGSPVTQRGPNNAAAQYQFGFVKEPVIRDLQEGGPMATQAYDLAEKLGTYRDIPIEVRLSKKEWDALKSN